MLDKYTVKDILKQIVEGSIKESNGNLNFRCVLCGDSKKSKIKKRGWVLFDNEKVTYHCFNCNESMSFNRFLKEKHPNLYKQYIRNRDFKTIFQVNKKDIKIVKTNSVEIITDSFMENSFNIFDRNIDKAKMMLQYIALKYCLNRSIPKKYLNTFRVCYSGKFRDRFLIPFYNEDGEVYCFQGRALTGKEPKYLTNKPEMNTKIFNYYVADTNEDVFITEGPIDAMFFKNSIATTGIAKYGTAEYEEINKKFKNRIWVFDNDATGKNNAIEYATKGERVFCWKKNFGVKDINELVVKNNLTKLELFDIVCNNTFTGFEAIIKLKML